MCVPECVWKYTEHNLSFLIKLPATHSVTNIHLNKASIIHIQTETQISGLQPAYWKHVHTSNKHISTLKWKLYPFQDMQGKCINSKRQWSAACSLLTLVQACGIEWFEFLLWWVSPLCELISLCQSGPHLSFEFMLMSTEVLWRSW